MIALDNAVMAWQSGRPVTRFEIGLAASALTECLPAGPVINLCEDRVRFLTGLVAAVLAGRRTILPPSRASEVVSGLGKRFGAAVPMDDAWVAAHVPATVPRDAEAMYLPLGDFPALSLFTSGSTGEPGAHDRRWRHLRIGARVLQQALEAESGKRYNFVATMPSQHMFGLETSIMLPLVGGHAVDAARPLLPEDVRRALHRLPEPRALVTTPLHLRACLEAGLDWPRVELILCATAPLDSALALRAESTLRGRLCEIFGSTETGALASRRTAHECAWTPLTGVSLRESGGIWLARGRHFQECRLGDALELRKGGRFLLRGRDADMVKIAGKRASLGDLNRALLSLPGVRDAVVLPPGNEQGGMRVTALVVAPELSVEEMRGLLRRRIDPVFLPRPLIKVERLPRNETGKLPADALDAMLAKFRAG